MKKPVWIIIVSSLLTLIIMVSFSKPFEGNAKVLYKKLMYQKEPYIEGDIIFQSGESRQCKAVKLATHSDYSHVGIITIQDGNTYVLEAIEPVCITPLSDWMKRGTGGHYTVMRLKERNTYIEANEIKGAQAIGKGMLGKHYDPYFGWDDDVLYCSELVWKIYKRGFDVELCTPRKMKDFDLSSQEVKSIMQHRYGNNPPLEEEVVAPSDLSASPLLYVVDKE